MAPTWFKLMMVIAVIVVLFGGRGRISEMMGDFAKGIKSFKNGMKDDEDTASAPKAVDQDAASLLKAPHADRGAVHAS